MEKIGAWGVKHASFWLRTLVLTNTPQAPYFYAHKLGLYGCEETRCGGDLEVLNSVLCSVCRRAHLHRSLSK